MSERKQEVLDETRSAETRAKWTRPEVDRLVAGGAEAGGSTTTDGVDIFS